MKTLSSTNALVVRDARPADAAALARVGRDGFRAAHRSIVHAATVGAIIAQLYTPEAVESCIASCAAAGDAHFIVAQRGGSVVAFLHYDAFGDMPELHRLYMDPALRRQGIGRALLQELERRLPRGATYVLLVADGNVPARRFYAREGFRLLERRPDGLAGYRRSMRVRTPPRAPKVPMLLLERVAAARPPLGALSMHTRAAGEGPPALRRWPAADPRLEHVLMETDPRGDDGVPLFAPAARWLSA